MALKVCQLCAVDFTLKHFLLPLIDGMRGADWQVIAVCAPGPAVQEMRAKGYRIETVDIVRSMNPLLAIRALWQLFRLFRRERFDILHAHTPVAALVGRLAARLAKVPLVVYTAHGFYFHEHMAPWQYRLFVLLERAAGRWTDLLFTQSEEDSRVAVAEGIVPADRVLAIGNGVDMRKFDPANVLDRNKVRKALGIPEDAYVIGMIGRLVREKGITEFLQAAVVMAKEFPHVWFLLIGERLASDHAEGVANEMAAYQSILGARLVAPGLRDDIPEMLNAMDLFCLPSWREGMPRTIIEAMMMAKPVIATNIRGAREEVINGVTGILVPVRAPTELADAMRLFISDQSWGRALGVAGQQRARAIYDEAKVVSLQIQRIAKERDLQIV